MGKAIKGVLADLFGSKKFLALLAGALVWLIGRAGLSVTEDQLLPVLGLIATYLLSQGIADLGKERAKVFASGLSSASSPEGDPDTDPG